ncbi:ABC transporter permease [Mammaliicoccus sciuri]|uniref:ABC transporter permease n=1 Tax=Mammaliicoccus sciuri TaxID=1296 RepID=UPI0007341462|nr:ABC transporter permease subunit [Mammaliicoccus sciuri]KTT86598.1 ABC transporter permease [Mammaliicoccus sciuri]KTT87136.1 ABC transporter permease [Mammaliicoccus sciuri]KTT91101.1 ABC transporter permease [Mammaliicoccus sciuri]KTT95313.1 ABC transporter permease [Mammaliicoccus sciuri]KTW11326.1 ABC transporter permease [Mammaliicoccus sciuri]
MNNLFNGVGQLTLFYLKTHKWKMLFWILGIVVLTVIIPPTFKSMYPHQSDMQPIVETSKNPAMEAMLGPGQFEHVSVGVLFTHEMLLFTSILVAIMSILLVSKSTRGDESAGRIEMIRALPVGKVSPLISALIEMIIVNIMITILIMNILPLMNINSVDWQGSIVYAVSLGSIGILFGMMTAIFSQLTETSSSVTGYSITVLLLSYLVRAVGDVINEDISMVSPLGWITRTFAYSENNWWPIVITLITAIIFLMIAMILYFRRDIESGLLPSKPGKRTAHKIWLSPLGLQLKLYKVGLISWAIGMFVFGASYGSIFGELDDFIKDNEMLQQMVSGKSDHYIEAFLPTLMIIMAIVSTIPALISLYKIKNEIDTHRIELIMSRPISRIKLLCSYLVVSLFNAIFMIFIAAFGLYVAQTSVLHDPFSFWTIIKSGIVHIPAIISFVALGVVLLGWFNKGHFIVYLYLTYTFFVVYLGQLLNIKDWLKDITPFHHIPEIPVEDMNYSGISILIILSVVLIIIGFIGFKRKDIS